MDLPSRLRRRAECLLRAETRPVTRRKRQSELPEEVLAVLRISPDLLPCRKFRNANIEQFAERINERKCELCMSLSRRWEKELLMMKSEEPAFAPPDYLHFSCEELTKGPQDEELGFGSWLANSQQAEE